MAMNGFPIMVELGSKVFQLIDSGSRITNTICRGQNENTWNFLSYCASPKVMFDFLDYRNLISNGEHEKLISGFESYIESGECRTI